MLSFYYIIKGYEAANSPYGYNTESIPQGARSTAHTRVSYSCGALSGQPYVKGERGRQ